jgi:hypothetical protein
MNLGPIELIIILLMCVPVLIVTTIGVILLARRRDLVAGKRVPCPHCAELIMPQAKVCRFCGRDLFPGWSDTQTNEPR